MREIAFIKQNKEKWLDIEQVVLGKIKKNPDDLSSLYINLINDCLFLRLIIPKVKQRYILTISHHRFSKRSIKQKNTAKQAKSIFMKEVPLIMYEYRKYLLLAFWFLLCLLL
jgi:hypothetical protein